MILNGVSVAASLIKKGEDPLVGRTELAQMFNIRRNDLVAAREKTGCYSLTRYHLNQAAELLEIKPTDFIYRVTPSMLKTEGSGRVTVTGAEAQSAGARGSLDPTGSYVANVETETDTTSLLVDLAGAALGKDYAPKDVSDRFELLKRAAQSTQGSYAAAIMGTLGVCHSVRYNAGSITQQCMDSNWGTEEARRQSAALIHLLLALYCAASTGAVLSMLRTFMAAGTLQTYYEPDQLGQWLRHAGRSLVGAVPPVRDGDMRQNARFDRLADAAQECYRMFYNHESKLVVRKSDSYDSLAAYSASSYIRPLGIYIEAFTRQFAQKTQRGDQLNVDALVQKANRLLRMTPQLIRQTA